MNHITIRAAGIDDCETLAAMIGALLTEHATAVPDDLAAALCRDGFGATPRFEALIAMRRGESLAMTLYYPVYRPSLRGHGLFMEDRYVRSQARRLGIGRALMSRLARLAKSRGCVYIEWCVEARNQAAGKFYAAAGADRDEGMVVCQIKGAALDALALDALALYTMANEEGSGGC